MNMKNKELGNFGERVICDYLIKNDFKILENKYYTKHGEIDIIAEDGDYLVFIEVKTRTDNDLTKKYGRPANAVNKTKWQHILYAANTYIKQNNIIGKKFRLDVAEVYVSPEDNGFMSARIKYIKSAYRR